MNHQSLRRNDIDTIKIKGPQIINEVQELSDNDDYDEENDPFYDIDGRRFYEYEEIDYKDQKNSNPNSTDVIRNCLLSIESNNLFSCGGLIYDALLPDLYIHNIGYIDFPLEERNLKEIINKSKMAPFGMKEKTIFDAKIRHTWQMEPSQFRIRDTLWDSTMNSLVQHVCNKLGCSSKIVKHSLYKLLIYEPGSFFKPHCDTEKEKGMFGTLIVVLPSVFSGGQLVVRHSGRECEYDFANMKGALKKPRFAAFYADCEHEIKPVTSGYRVCLVYNLVSNDAKIQSNIKDHAAILKQMIEAIEDWIVNIHTRPALLLYAFDHQYTYDGLSFNCLKGKDIIIAQVLKEVSKSIPLDIALVNMKRGFVELSHADKDRTTITESFSEIGAQLQLKRILIHHDDMIQANFWNDKHIDDEEGSILTGNEGAIPALFYQHTGIIFSPKQIRHYKYLRRNLKSSVEYLNTLKEECDRREAMSILTWAIKNSSKFSHCYSPDDIFNLFNAIVQYDYSDVEIFDAVLDRFYFSINNFSEIAWKFHREFPNISINPVFRILVGYIIGDLEKNRNQKSDFENIIKFRKLLDIEFESKEIL